MPGLQVFNSYIYIQDLVIDIIIVNYPMEYL